MFNNQSTEAPSRGTQLGGQSLLRREVKAAAFSKDTAFVKLPNKEPKSDLFYRQLLLSDSSLFLFDLIVPQIQTRFTQGPWKDMSVVQPGKEWVWGRRFLLKQSNTDLTPWAVTLRFILCDSGHCVCWSPLTWWPDNLMTAKKKVESRPSTTPIKCSDAHSSLV